MSQPYTDGIFDVIDQTKPAGPKRYSLPLQDEGLFYTRQIEQDYTLLPGAVGGQDLVGQRASVENVLTYSSDFTNAAWYQAVVTTTADAATAPDGTTTADKLAPTVADSYTYQTFTPSGTVEYTWGVWLKSATGSSFTISLVADDAVTNLLNKTITVTPSWQFFSGTFTAASTSTHYVYIGALSTWSTGEDLYAWGASLTETSDVRAYVPTTAAAANFASAPLVHPEWPSAYLVGQSDASTAAGSSTITMTYAEIPEESTVYVDIPLTLPTAGDAGGTDGGAYGYEITGPGTGTSTGGQGGVYSSNVFVDGKIFGDSIDSVTRSNVSGNAYFEFPSHGLAGTELINIYGVWAGGAFQYGILDSSDYTVVNANYISATGWGSSVALIANQAVLWLFNANYTPGSTTVRGRDVTTSYLPGATAGITTAEDITVPAVKTSPAAFLDAVIAQSGTWENYDVKALLRWNNAIYRQTVTQVNFATLS